MRSTKYLALLFACAMLPGALAGCEVHVESETPLMEDAGPVEEDVSPETDGKTDPDPDTGTPDTGTPDTGVADGGDAGDNTADGGGMTEEEMVERGDYLVNHVSICVDCHTPRTNDGQFDETRHLAGVDCFVDFDPAVEGSGCISTRNLTNHETGLKKYTDDQVFELLRTGETMHEGEKRVLFPLMPYWTFANYPDEDLRSIIAYLRTVPGVDNRVQEKEPMTGPFAITNERTEPAVPVLLDEYPDSTLQPGEEGYDQAQKGKLLVAVAGCADCHTPATLPPEDDPNSDWVPADRTALMQGGREFPHAGEVVTTTNLTPHDTGIWDYGPEEIRIAIKAGKDSDNRQLCPPMPGGPDSPYGGMTDEDALAIGWYLTTLPPIDNPNPECHR